MADVNKPFNPIRVTGKGGLATVEELSRVQDLIKGWSGTLIRNLTQLFQQLDVDITTITTTPGPQGQQGIPGNDGEPGQDGQPGPPGATGARGVQGPPGQDGQDGADGLDSFIPGPPGPRGATGIGVPGMDGQDGEDGRPGATGPMGPPGPMGPAMVLLEDDAPEPMIFPPGAPQRSMTLQFGYGPDNFDGTLPTLAEAIPHFWLHPYTYLDNVSAISVGSSNALGVIEFPVLGGPYTRCELWVHVVSSSITGDGLDVAVTKNGADTSVTTIIGNSESDDDHNSEASDSFRDGDTVGVHVSARATYVSGSLLAHFLVRLS